MDDCEGVGTDVGWDDSEGWNDSEGWDDNVGDDVVIGEKAPRSFQFKAATT